MLHPVRLTAVGLLFLVLSLFGSEAEAMSTPAIQRRQATRSLVVRHAKDKVALAPYAKRQGGVASPLPPVMCGLRASGSVFKLLITASAQTSAVNKYVNLSNFLLATGTTLGDGVALRFTRDCALQLVSDDRIIYVNPTVQSSRLIPYAQGSQTSSVVLIYCQELPASVLYCSTGVAGDVKSVQVSGTEVAWSSTRSVTTYTLVAPQ